MAVPVGYHVRSLFRRRGATAFSVVAIALGVAVLTLVLALARGFELSLRDTGRPDNLVVLREGATSEGESGMTREMAQILTGMPGVARDDEGPLASPELYAAVSLEKQGGGTTNVPFRGVSPRAPAIETTATLGEGRWFAPGTTEVVLGKALLERLEGARLGGAIRFDGRDWPVVGVLDAPGQAYNSEIWGDVEVMSAAFDRPGGYNVVVLRLAEGVDAATVIERIEDDPRLTCKAMTQPAYFASQVGLLGAAIKFLGVFLAVIMSLGSGFGATNTLLASLQGRRREIGTLLAIGFRPFAVFLGFLIEAGLLGLLGGLLGLVLALPVHGVATGTTNWNTFTEQAFTFKITLDVALTALFFGSFVGLLGGTYPAWRASRLPPTEALRAL